MLQAITKRMPLASCVDLSTLAAAAVGRVAADMAGICLNAALTGVREAASTLEATAGEDEVLAATRLEMRHFLHALTQSSPSVMRGWSLPEVRPPHEAFAINVLYCLSILNCLAFEPMNDNDDDEYDG
jgi:SpoVK/Ycf46/Vps4 family AAA+-type ATPase